MGRRHLVIPSKEDLERIIVETVKLSKVAEDLDMSITKLHNLITEYGLKHLVTPRHCKLSKYSEEEFLKVFKAAKSFKEIQTKLGTDASKQAIWSRAKKYGVKRDKRKYNKGRAVGCLNKPKININENL